MPSAACGRCLLRARSGAMSDTVVLAARHSMPDPRCFDICLEPERVGRWLTARDDRIVAPPAHGMEVPLPFLVFLRMQPALGVSIHEWLGRDPERGLYGGVSYSAIRLPRVGETLSATSGVTERRQVPSAMGELTVTTLQTSYHAGRDELVRETVRMIDLPASGRPPAGPGSASSEPEAGREPLLAELPGISRRQAAWMTVETGDHNALHVDPVVASRRGFADVVVPAPLLTALIERELAELLGRHPCRLDVRYQAPTLPDAPLALRGHREGVQVSFTLSGQGITRATGRAALVEEART